MVLSFLINNGFHIGTRFFEVKKYVFSMFYNFKKPVIGKYIIPRGKKG